MGRKSDNSLKKLIKKNDAKNIIILKEGNIKHNEKFEKGCYFCWLMSQKSQFQWA